jgi:hypothetical protein
MDSHSSILDLPGLSSADGQRLLQMGIFTTADLLRSTGSVSRQQELARQLKCSSLRLQRWMALASLARLDSVGTTYCGLLLHSGIANIDTLAIAIPERLHRRILRLYVGTKQRREFCPSVATVRSWILDAKQFTEPKL